MGVKFRNPLRRLGIVALATLAVLTGHPQQSQAAIEGCPSDTDRKGDKIVIGSVSELVGEIGTRRARALLAAFEMRFEKAQADLGKEVTIVYCDERPVRSSTAYNRNVVANLNDEQLLLEVGARPDGSDISVTYVVIPIRHYAFADDTDQDKGYHQAVYEQSLISAGLEQLFKDNAELRLMAALALALRHEKLAGGESDPALRRALVHRSRAFFCDAVGALARARRHRARTASACKRSRVKLSPCWVRRVRMRTRSSVTSTARSATRSSSCVS